MFKEYYEYFLSLSDEDKMKELISLFHYIAIYPEIYMFLTIVINEYKKNNSFPLFAIPYLISILVSAFVIDNDFDKEIKNNKKRLYKKLND